MSNAASSVVASVIRSLTSERVILALPKVAMSGLSMKGRKPAIFGFELTPDTGHVRRQRARRGGCLHSLRKVCVSHGLATSVQQLVNESVLRDR